MRWREKSKLKIIVKKALRLRLTLLRQLGKT